jgi:hypothetical protein
MRGQTKWEQGFIAGYGIVFPELTEALEKIAKLEAEVKRLEGVINLHNMKMTHEAIRRCNETIRDARAG